MTKQILNLKNNFVSQNKFGVEQEVLWPFVLFSIRMYVPTQLNIFENTLLKICKAGFSVEDRNLEKLSHMMGLELDLISFIRSKLTEKEFLEEDQQYKLTTKGIEYNEYENTNVDNDNCSIKNIGILFDQISQKILPIVLDLGLIRYENHYTLDATKKFAIFEIGSAGTKEKYQYRIIKENSKEVVSDPSFSQIMKCIQSYQMQKSYYFPLLNVEEFDNKYPVYKDSIFPENQAISDAESFGITVTSKDHIYIKTKIVIPKNSDQVEVLNPFGFFKYQEHTNAFKRAFKNDDKLAAWLESIKTFEPNLLDRQNLEEQFEVKQEINGFSDYVFAYPEIYQKLKAIQDEMPHVDTSHQLKINAIEVITKNLYDLLEWTFLFCFLENQTISSKIDAFMQTDDKTRNQEIYKIAQSLNLNINDPKVCSLLRMRRVSLSDLRKGLDLPTIFCLLLISAKISRLHPFNWLLKKQKSFFEKVSILRDMRNQVAHGETLTEFGELKDIISFFYQSIKIIMPKLINPKDHKDQSIIADDDSYLMVLEASKARDQDFNDLLFKSKYAEVISDELLQSYLAIQNMQANIDQPKTFDISQYIYCMYGCFQQLLIAIISNNKSTNRLSQSNLIELAQDKAISYQFNLSHDQLLPYTLKSVRSNFLNDALQGISSTLGAHLLTLLLILDADKLEIISIKSKDLIVILSQLITLRGHGNQSIWKTKEELLILKNQYTSLLKSLLDE